jgi:hypothetical protein
LSWSWSGEYDREPGASWKVSGTKLTDQLEPFVFGKDGDAEFLGLGKF